MMVSFVRRCHETNTTAISLDDVFGAIRDGGHGLKEKITLIRNRYEGERDITGDPKKARKFVADLKMDLPGFLPSGTFTKRDNDSLVEYSGLLCADIDMVGSDNVNAMKEALKTLPFVRAVAVSPSGDGLKVFFNVVNDPLRHSDSFRSIQENLRDSFEIEIDQKCKDLSRICLFTYDPEIWVRTEGNEPIPPADPLPVPQRMSNPGVNLADRQRIAIEVLGQAIDWDSATHGFLVCPGKHLHTQANQHTDCQIHIDGAPNIWCFHTSCTPVLAGFNKTLQSWIGKAEKTDFIAFAEPYRGVQSARNPNSPNGEKDLTPEKPLIEFCTPDDLESYVPPDGIQLIGDYHIVKDGAFVFVIGGPAGVGKSLAIMSLACAGAKGEGEWFGLKIHRKFKTLIIQAENGMFRLSRNFKELHCSDLQDFVRVSKPPPYGMIFQRSDFRHVLSDYIAEFGSDIVGVDPWNSVARDQEQKTYLETFDLIRSVLPSDTVLGILAHTRKPQKEERSVGRALQNILAGSHVMTSVPRSVFVLQYASDDTEDDEVVFTCCKNNDGELGKRSAWKRKVGLFEPVPGFDWATFDASAKDKRVVITKEMVEEIFEGGQLLITDARDKLHELSGADNSTCWRAINKKNSRFIDNLVFKGNFVDWIRSAT